MQAEVRQAAYLRPATIPLYQFRNTTLVRRVNYRPPLEWVMPMAPRLSRHVRVLGGLHGREAAEGVSPVQPQVQHAVAHHALCIDCLL